MKCESCSMPMEKDADHGKSDPSCKYCKYCAPDGNLKTKEEVRNGWVQALMNLEHISKEEAEKVVDRVMPTMPAWQNTQDS